MRVLVLAGLMTAATVSFAAAEESVIDCQFTDVSRAQADQRLDQPPAAPTPTARPVIVQREAAEAPRPATAAERRRSGKPIPDAQLIQPRGAL
ncbi:MAG: hypothetical protein JNL81_17575 [Hyphomonadaceae bacterium]|nr:hypothetical protein [Hyphomonadaceae bacterium]